jgi:hypothetical protein
VHYTTCLGTTPNYGKDFFGLRLVFSLAGTDCRREHGLQKQQSDATSRGGVMFKEGVQPAMHMKSEEASGAEKTVGSSTEY